MRVQEIMTRNVIHIRMDDTLERIRELFKKFKVHHLPVMEEKQLVGIISDRDLAYTLSPFLNTPESQSRDVALLQKKAHQIMTRDVITVSRKTSIEDACRIMLENDISCLPVVTPEGEVDGIITWRDLFRALLKLDRI